MTSLQIAGSTGSLGGSRDYRSGHGRLGSNTPVLEIESHARTPQLPRSVSQLLDVLVFAGLKRCSRRFVDLIMLEILIR